MQLLQAGAHQVLQLELEEEALRQSIQEAGFQAKVTDHGRTVLLELSGDDREGPLLLFDAADPANTGWFSRCQFYVEARTGVVLQTPFMIANRYDRHGRLQTRVLDVQIVKELPAHFRLPGRQPVSEKVIYNVLYNFLNALAKVGVGLCGSQGVKPTIGRAENVAKS